MNPVRITTTVKYSCRVQTRTHT